MPITQVERAQNLSAILCLSLCGAALGGAIYRSEHCSEFLLFAGVLGIVALVLIAGQYLSIVKAGREGFEIQTSPPPKPEPIINDSELDARMRDPEARHVKQPDDHAGERRETMPTVLPPEIRPLPGINSPLPVLRLDADFCVLDWNEAFGLAFDNTLEGCRGEPLYKRWVYYLDNYPEVVRQWKTVLCGPQAPRFHHEEIRYQSSRYGAVHGTKRMYQVFAENNAVESWICIFDIVFPDHGPSKFQGDLIAVLRDDLLWSEYAIHYDRVVLNTKVYPELVSDVVGSDKQGSKLPRISDSAKILDLGCGTGNVSFRLARSSSRRQITAVDKNTFMLEIARSKCEPYLATIPQGKGVTFVRQDITTLRSFPDSYYDVAILTNVLYAVTDANKCLEEVYRVLKPGGEIRLTGPRKDTDTAKLLTCIKSDLQAANKLPELDPDYNKVYEINMHRLKTGIERWDVEQVAAMLSRAGFVGKSGAEIWRSTDIYAGQAMMLWAVKPGRNGSP